MFKNSKTMKLIVCLCALLLLCATCAFAAVEFHSDTQNITIRTDGGNTKYTMEEGTIVLRQKSDNAVVYRDQFPINEDGGFTYKFKFKGNINDCDLYIKDSIGNPIEQYVTIVDEEVVTTAILNVELDNNGLFIADNEKAQLKAKITNLYGDEDEYELIIAMYDENGALIRCELSGVRNINYDANTYEEVFSVNVPKETAKLKGFMLYGIQNIKPFTAAVEQKFSNYITLPNIISDNMLVQANQPIKIWGNASYVGEVITSELVGTDGTIISHGEAVVDSDGTFSIAMSACEANRNCTLKVYTEKEEKIVNNVMVGDLWLMSGQSNMELKVKTLTSSVKNQILPGSEIDDIRLFTVDRSTAGSGEFPQKDVPGKWVVANANNVNNFSAVGYVAIKEMHDRLDIPMGGIDASVGGSFMAQWVAEDNEKGLKAGPYFNSLIAPFTNMNIKGILWYQGENGEDRTPLTIDSYSLFTERFDNLIGSWRNTWENDQLPVVFVQLPVGNFDFSKVRLAQTEAFKTIDNTAMAVIVDCVPNSTLYPSEEPIHFHDKIPVGKRLAYSALKYFCGYDIHDGVGPMIDTVEYSGNKVTLTFTNVENGLRTTDGEAPKFFTIAGSDGNYYEAAAKIVSTNKVELTCDAVSSPVSVRYLMEYDDGFISVSDNVYPKANFVNSAGIPCGSFVCK